MTDYVSQTQYGKFEDFNLQVARGQIQGHSNVIVFGYNPDVDTSYESVWPDGGVVPHPTSASVLQVSSTSASDTSAGVGARTVYIEGLNAAYAVISETVVLDGQTAVPTVHSYLYVNQLYVLTAGTSGHNVGTVNVGTGTVTAGVPAVLYDLIAPTYNNRTTSHYCVSAGYTGYLVTGVLTAGQASGTTGVTATLNQHGLDGLVRVVAISTLNNGSIEYNFTPPIPIPEKNCVGAQAIGASNNNSVSTFFNIVLIKNSTGY
jgi:hypothetical protein